MCLHLCVLVPVHVCTHNVASLSVFSLYFTENTKTTNRHQTQKIVNECLAKFKYNYSII